MARTKKDPGQDELYEPACCRNRKIAAKKEMAFLAAILFVPVLGSQSQALQALGIVWPLSWPGSAPDIRAGLNKSGSTAYIFYPLEGRLLKFTKSPKETVGSAHGQALAGS